MIVTNNKSQEKKRAGFVNARVTSRVIAVLLALICLALIPALPLVAQQKKEARRVGEPSETKRNNRVKVIEPKRNAVRDEAPVRKNVRRVNEPKPKVRRDVKIEESVRTKPRQRKELPIIEGKRRTGSELRAPGRVFQDRMKRESAPRGRNAADADIKVKDTLDRFRRDWVNGDSRAITDLLSNRSRVKITIESKEINNSFSRGQAQYVLKEYLSSADSRDLSFSRFRISSSDGFSAYGVGKMKMRDRKTGKMINQTVFLSLAREGEDWAVREIRLTE